MTPERPSQHDVLEWTTKFSNWGRWGDDDVLGTLNFVTPDVRRQAVEGVRSGRVVSCAQMIDPARPGMEGVARRYVHKSGEGLADPDRVAARARWSSAADEMHLRAHGLSLTHLDAPAHYHWDGKMYNGRPAERMTTAFGATELGIEIVSDGIVTRGVLLDIPAVLGVPFLEPGDHVHPELLDAAEARQGVRVRSGDAVLLRVGFSEYHALHPDWSFTSDGQAGWQASCLPWLYEREVALIGHDGGNDCFPSGYAETPLPVHVVGIPNMGLWILDSCDLSALARACAEEERWEFLFTVAPLPFKGATGCAVNPLALL